MVNMDMIVTAWRVMLLWRFYGKLVWRFSRVSMHGASMVNLIIRITNTDMVW